MLRVRLNARAKVTTASAATLRRAAVAATLLLLCGCANTLHILKYELSVTRVRADTPPITSAARPKPESDTVAALRRAGFDTYLCGDAAGLNQAWYARGQTAHAPVADKSVSKALLTTAFAAAEAQGLVSRDTALNKIDGCPVPAALQPLTPAVLANMGAGFHYAENAMPAVYAGPEWACRILNLPPQVPSGSRFNYGTAQSHLLSLHLTDSLRQPLNRVIDNLVLTPIGAQLDGWTRNQDGDVFGGSELLLQPRELYSFGRLFLQGGVADGTQVLPAEFVASTREPVYQDTGRAGFAYSWGWWLTQLSGQPVQIAEGYGGQMIVIAHQSEQIFVFTAPTGGWVTARQHQERVQAGLEMVTAALSVQRKN